MIRVGMKISMILRPALARRAGKAHIAELLILIAWGIGVLFTPTDMVQDEIWVDIKVVGMGDGDEPQQAVFAAKPGGDGALLILVSKQ
jgi:hypothetical protein